METSMQAVRDTASGRQMFEHLRNLGLTYESDQAQSLIAKAKAQEGADSSMKNALLKLTQANQDQALAQKADQAMTQITGQQLLSKTDSSLQSMMFTIPFLLQDQAEQVKIFVNSKNEQQKIDWENCQLYFLLETKKLGDVGIMLSAVERTLSITIKNDRPENRGTFQKGRAKTTNSELYCERIRFFRMKTQYFNQKNRKQLNGPSAAVIRFNEREDQAPTVVAQGRGQLAAKIIELAKKNNVQMEEDACLVQNLLDIDLGDNIPPQLYSVMAEVLLMIEEMEKGY